jgi:hypothetical protein
MMNTISLAKELRRRYAERTGETPLVDWVVSKAKVDWLCIAKDAIELVKKADGFKCPINYEGCTKNCGSYGCGN